MAPVTHVITALQCNSIACQCFWQKFMESSIMNPALSLLMKHLVIGQRQKPPNPNFLAFHWSPHGSLVSIGQHFVTTRVVHLPKRTETTLITQADLITQSEQAVRAVHCCNSPFNFKVFSSSKKMSSSSLMFTTQSVKKENC